MSRIPVVKSLHIESFTGTAIDAADYFNINAIIGEYDDGRLYATQRPSIDIFDEASSAGVPAKGRGVYFWDKAGDGGDRYIVVDDKVYKGTLSSPAIATISPGTSKVYFVEMVNWLVILDPENNEGWYIQNIANWDTVVQITDPNFPGNISGVNIVGGGAFLDGRLYVGGDDAAVYNSNSNTPVDWNSLDKISAEREADGGIYLDKQLDNIIMFGSRTIEFFYNNRNPTGSPLSRRKDVFHNIGMMQPDAAWREGDDLYFVGVYPSGPLQVLKLRDFQLESISTPEVESFITNARLVEDSQMTSSGFTAGKRSFYVITFYRLVGGELTPSISLCFDGVSWGLWDTNISGLTRFPLIGWTIRSGSSARSGEGIMSNGDLVTVTDDFVPVDTLLQSGYIEDGYVADGYYTSSGGAGIDILAVVRTGPFDGSTNKWKFGHSVEIVGDETEGDHSVQLRWADGNSVNFNAGRSIPVSRKAKESGLGRFKRRNHEIVIDMPEQYRVEGIEFDFTEGGH